MNNENHRPTVAFAYAYHEVDNLEIEKRKAAERWEQMKVNAANYTEQKPLLRRIIERFNQLRNPN